LTFITLLIHRIRAARAAQRERAPEDIVRRLPWRVYTGTGWEKHEGDEPVCDSPCVRSSDVDLEEGRRNIEVAPLERGSSPTAGSDASTSDGLIHHPWFETQLECAICLTEFAKGDRVRVLPCQHIFHLSEVDEWLIHRKKLVGISLPVVPSMFLTHSKCPICKADVTRPPHPSNPQTSPPSTVIRDAPASPSSHGPEATEQTPLLFHGNEEHD
jgi:E3 ubiquitin-protein ligase RNF13